MRKIFTIVFAILTVISITLTVSATGNIYVKDGITIEFAETSAFSFEQQVSIAERIIHNEDYASITTYNLLCTMFGHKTTIETIGIIEHCVSETAPRCLKTVQDVTVCTRCEEIIDINTISSYYIFCCD